MELQLKRIASTSKQTVGHLFVKERKNHTIGIYATIELPFLDNQKQISCIPVGDYTVKKRWSIKYGNHLEVQNVPNRTYILIHSGNYFTQTKGCVLLGFYHAHLNPDNELDCVNSREALRSLLALLPDYPVKLTVSHVFEIETWE